MTHRQSRLLRFRERHPFRGRRRERIRQFLCPIRLRRQQRDLSMILAELLLQFGVAIAQIRGNRQSRRRRNPAQPSKRRAAFFSGRELSYSPLRYYRLLRSLRDPLHQALPRPLRNRLLLGAHADYSHIHKSLRKGGATICALIQMRLHVAILLRCQRLHGIERQVFLRDVRRLAQTCNAFLIVISANRILVFTVPSGSPVFSEISEWLNPSKKASSTDFCCSTGSESITPRTFSSSEFRSASCARLVEEGKANNSTGSEKRRLRITSIERFRATTTSQPPSDPRPETKAPGFFHIWTKISCITSSASPVSFNTRNATEYTMVP